MEKLFEARAVVLECQAKQRLVEKEIELERLRQKPKREPLTDEEMQKITKLVAEKCAEIADTAEPYKSGDLIRKHFKVDA